MKRFILSIAITVGSLVLTAQTSVKPQPVSYEAANWKTFLIDNPKSITIAPAPTAAQSKTELTTVRERASNVDEKKLNEIKYWNAGAPSYRWNQVVGALMAKHQELQLRFPSSWMNIAIYDATILAWQEKKKNKRTRPNAADPSIKASIEAPLTYSYPCEHSVTAAAAAYVLAYFVPTKADSIIQLAKTASQSRIDAGVAYPSDVEAGWKIGEEVAKQIIEKAKNDGSALKWDGQMNKDPKKWTGKYPMGITIAKYTPFLIKADQFRPAAPPDWENDMNELRKHKQTFKSAALAYEWASSGNQFVEFANQKMFENRMSDDAPTVARIYAILNAAYHDAGIAIMDAKYAYWGIRPDQYDTTYKPLISTPPFPGYPSGHAAGSGTASAVLEYFFPEDAKQLRQMAQDCADSRFYAGIHFKTDNEVGLKMGRELGKYFVETFMGENNAKVKSQKSKD